MQVTLAGLIEAIRFTLQSPREGARWVIGLGLPARVGWTALMLTAVISTLLSSAALAFVPVAMDPAMTVIFGSPLRLAVLQMAGLAIGALLVFGVGRQMGGKGDLAATLAVTSWLEVILIAVQAVQLVVMMIAPLLGDVIGLFGLVLFLWLLAQFVAELHGFASAWKVLGGVFATVFVLALAVTVLSALLVVLGGFGNV